MSIVSNARNVLRIFTDRLSIRRDSGPIRSITELEYFVATRSSFVSQKTLYGYLKARMGTRYPSMFEDDVFVESVNIAKAHVFAACVSDLTIFSFANAFSKGRYSESDFRKAALQCFSNALDENRDGLPEAFSVSESVEAFSSRVATTDWRDAALDRKNFTESGKAILRRAPIAPNLKKDDTDIVSNSINFAWTEVRQDFRKRMDPAAFHPDDA